MRRIRAEHASHPETQGWWPIGQGIGYGASFVNQAADLLARWPGRRVDAGSGDRARGPGGLQAIEQAAAERRWVSLAEVKGHDH